MICCATLTKIPFNYEKFNNLYALLQVLTQKTHVACCTEPYPISLDNPILKSDNQRTMADTHSLAFNRFELVRGCLQSKQYYCVKVNDRHILLHRNAIKSNGSGWSLELPLEIILKSFGTKQTSNIDAVLVNHQLDEHLYDIIVFPDKSASIVNRNLVKTETEDGNVNINEDEDLQILNYCAPPEHPSSPVAEQQSTIEQQSTMDYQINKQDDDNDSSYNSFIQDLVSPMTSPCYAEFSQILESFDKEEIQQLPPPPSSSPPSFKETQNLDETITVKSSPSILSTSQDLPKDSNLTQQLNSSSSKLTRKRSSRHRKTFTPVCYSKRKLTRPRRRSDFIYDSLTCTLQSFDEKLNDAVITRDENENDGIILSPQLVSNALITMDDTFASSKSPTKPSHVTSNNKEIVETKNVSLFDLGEEMEDKNCSVQLKSRETHLTKNNNEQQKCKLPLYTSDDLSWLSSIGIQEDYINKFIKTLDDYQKSTIMTANSVKQRNIENIEKDIENKPITLSTSTATSITVNEAQQENQEKLLESQEQLPSQLSAELLNNEQHQIVTDSAVVPTVINNNFQYHHNSISSVPSIHHQPQARSFPASNTKTSILTTRKIFSCKESESIVQNIIDYLDVQTKIRCRLDITNVVDDLLFLPDITEKLFTLRTLSISNNQQQNMLAWFNLAPLLQQINIVQTEQNLAVYIRYSALLVPNLHVFIGLLTCGIFLFLLSILGLCTVLRHHQVGLFFYIFLLFLLFLVQFILACTYLAVNSHTKYTMLKDAWLSVRNSEIRSSLQTKYNCCPFDNTTTAAMEKCGNITSTSYCYPVLQAHIDHGLKLAGLSTLLFSFTQIIGIWLTLRYRNLRDPNINLNIIL
ncbi:unnamed protein product [Didymodactylos carnosus]|uniref:Tetraspanin n=1 Tax=Didymodactylos carnosus TaxID=1234261 RepID=A0A8S2CV51_9BILA|nr:unnamed protein product [Didymodactylos carnosus]CAF3513265.1 unnamed protein product [Didymodactylos carnosus]